jgi:hypothetical protein
MVAGSNHSFFAGIHKVEFPMGNLRILEASTIAILAINKMDQVNTDSESRL